MSAARRCGVSVSTALFHRSGRAGTTVEVAGEKTPFTNPLLSSSGASAAVPHDRSVGASSEDAGACSCPEVGA